MERLSQRELILQGAHHCLATHGYVNVSMRDIASEAGVTLSQLNYYFKNKEGLYSAVMNRVMNEHLARLRSILSMNIEVREKLKCIVNYFTDFKSAHSELVRLFLDFSAQSLWITSFREQIIAFNNELEEIMLELIRSHRVETGFASDLDDVDLAKFMSSAMIGMTVRITFLGDDADSGHEVVYKLLEQRKNIHNNRASI